MSQFDALIDVVKKKANVQTDADAGRILRLAPAVVSQSRTVPRQRESWWATRFRRLWDEAYSQGMEAGRSQCVQRLLDAVEESHVATTQQEKARAFGVKQATVSYWLAGSAAPTVTSLKKLLNRRAMIRIEQIAELEPIDPIKKRVGWWMDSDSTKRATWQSKLLCKSGIYLYHDSRRRVTYVGKANQTNLFTEIEQRLRDAKIRGTHFDTGLVKRLERGNPMCQGEVARYISIYGVSDRASIHNLEVLLIRAFMNDHLNRNGGNFKK